MIKTQPAIQIFFKRQILDEWVAWQVGRGPIEPNAMRALLEVPGSTLLMLPRLLIDEPFRMRLNHRYVRDPVVRAYWLNEYARYTESFRREAIAPIQNKIGKALMIPSLRNMLAQPKSTITPRRLMDEGAIVNSAARSTCPSRSNSAPQGAMIRSRNSLIVARTPLRGTGQPRP